MDGSLEARIKRAKELLRTARNAAMATVNEDGSPHNTPFYFIHDDTLRRVFWSSRPGALHCRNAERTGQIFVVLYESDRSGGLYLKATGAHELAGPELADAMAIHNAMRQRDGKGPIPETYYTESDVQRMYSAVPTNYYVNVTRRDENGFVVEEYRHEIKAEELYQS